MDADRTPSARGGPTVATSWRGVDDTGNGNGAHRPRTHRTLTHDTPTERFATGDVLTDPAGPDRRRDHALGPVAVPEASDLFDELVSRRRYPVAQAPMHTRLLRDRKAARPQRSGIRLGWAYVVVLVALAVAVAVGATSRAQLHRTDTQLTAVRARLHQTVGRARAADTALHAVSAQANGAARLLVTETDQLASVQSQLASTEANVFANGVSINNLDTCLSGVEQALNEISLGDQHDAATTLNGVAASCRAATPAP